MEKREKIALALSAGTVLFGAATFLGGLIYMAYNRGSERLPYKAALAPFCLFHPHLSYQGLFLRSRSLIYPWSSG